MTLKSIKRSKKSIYIEKVEFNQKSLSFRSLFDFFSISFDRIRTFQLNLQPI